MARVTSKLQVTVPKVIAQLYHIRPGDDVQWVAAGDSIRVVPAGGNLTPLDREERLRLFDRATARQQGRNANRSGRRTGSRGWTRAEVYDRGRAR
ncbi:MAG TPA: AbrB/MazE/SpoVT family DNA-binding domain-containing protein [Vicinamibacteria bacterium]|nr:AbrB/MazE/SpoVT family DNA-binding domain-containing protein [Vicinamibacteria bacterium]